MVNMKDCLMMTGQCYANLVMMSGFLLRLMGWQNWVVNFWQITEEAKKNEIR